MAISNAQLDYDAHIGFYANLGMLTGDDREDAYWHRQAEYMHALSIFDAIRDVHLDAVSLGHRVARPEAKLQLQFGVGRRTKFLWLSLQHLVGLVHPGRTEPLAHDDVEQAAQDLNAIYINIRGTLDNLAWCLLDLFGEQRTRDIAKTTPQIVSLFGKGFLKDQNLGAIAMVMNGFDEWNRDLRTRRDPAAHRIPLSVPPALLDVDTLESYKGTQQEWVEASTAALKAANEGADSSALFQKAEELNTKLESIGSFRPLFVHHPDDGAMSIYPTVPQDIGQLVRIARELFAAIADNHPA